MSARFLPVGLLTVPYKRHKLRLHPASLHTGRVALRNDVVPLKISVHLVDAAGRLPRCA